MCRISDQGADLSGALRPVEAAKATEGGRPTVHQALAGAGRTSLVILEDIPIEVNMGAGQLFLETFGLVGDLVFSSGVEGNPGDLDFQG